MKYSQIKEIKSELDNIWCDSWREFVENVRDGQTDFVLDDHRFIHCESIDEVMAEELGSDEYLLGCFNPNFLAKYIDMDEEHIRSVQEKCPEMIGKLVISQGQLDNVQSGYVSADGYGHHFAHYDSEEHDLPCGFYGFRVN